MVRLSLRIFLVMAGASLMAVLVLGKPAEKMMKEDLETAEQNYYGGGGPNYGGWDGYGSGGEWGGNQFGGSWGGDGGGYRHHHHHGGGGGGSGFNNGWGWGGWGNGGHGGGHGGHGGHGYYG